MMQVRTSLTRRVSIKSQPRGLSTLNFRVVKGSGVNCRTVLRVLCTIDSRPLSSTGLRFEDIDDQAELLQVVGGEAQGK